MAEQKEEPVVQQEEEEDEAAKNYKPPAEKSVDELLKTDAEDESLRKYKASLGVTGSVVVDENDPRQVIVKKLGLLVADREEVTLDLSDLAAVKKKSFILKEGCQYRIKIYFYTQREIVCGLKYLQKTSRKGIKVDKSSHMLGSYPPKKEMQDYTTPLDEAPSGMLARGSYHVKSSFVDDDKKEHVQWEWNLEIKKDWA